MANTQLTQSNKSRHGHPPAALFVFRTNKGKHQKAKQPENTHRCCFKHKQIIHVYILIDISHNDKDYKVFCFCFVSTVNRHSQSSIYPQHSQSPMLHLLSCSAGLGQYCTTLSCRGEGVLTLSIAVQF